MAQTGAIILAAGAATRMGRLKQLLMYGKGTLIEFAIHQVQLAGFTPVVVVLGSQAAAVAGAIRHTGVHTVVNEFWSSGMGSSVSTGIATILELDPQLAGVAILLADQPHVTAAHLEHMRRSFDRRTAPILAAEYAGQLGVPALFRASVFSALATLHPEAGARALLRDGEHPVEAYPLPEAAIDIDTPEDFAALSN